MVILTDQAAQVLRATLDETRTEPGQALRLLLRPGGGFGLGVDQEREGDQVVTADGEKILLMTPNMAEAVDDVTIDTKNTEEGPKLVISRR